MSKDLQLADLEQATGLSGAKLDLFLHRHKTALAALASLDHFEGTVSELAIGSFRRLSAAEEALGKEHRSLLSLVKAEEAAARARAARAEAEARRKAGEDERRERELKEQLASGTKELTALLKHKSTASEQGSTSGTS